MPLILAKKLQLKGDPRPEETERLKNGSSLSETDDRKHVPCSSRILVHLALYHYEVARKCQDKMFFHLRALAQFQRTEYSYLTSMSLSPNVSRPTGQGSSRCLRNLPIHLGC